MNRILFLLTLLFSFTPKFAQKARAQGGPPTPDTIISLPCDKKPEMLKFVSLFPYPNITPDTVGIHLASCVPLYLQTGFDLKGFCSQIHINDSLGNSCNRLTSFSENPTCVMMFKTKDSTVLISGVTRDATGINKLWIDYAWVLASTMARPDQNKPNSPKWLVAELYDGNWNLKAKDSVNVNKKFTKDSAGWVQFTFGKDFGAGKEFHILVYGTDPVYGWCDPFKQQCNPPIWEFFGFKLEFLCSGPQASCNWDSLPKQIWRDPLFEFPCVASESWQWTSSCGKSYIAQYNFYDREGPKIVKCPKDVTISLPKGNCEVDYVTPPVVVTDNCAGNLIKVSVETPFGRIDENGGIISDVRAGKWNITYLAEDVCGNQSNPCSYNLTVTGASGFSIVCKGSTVVSLNDSCSLIPAKTFVVGTSDLCCPSYTVYGMRMDDQKWGKNVKFCCSDVGKQVAIMLTAVSDCDTLSQASCMVNVTVQDKSAPRITCPADRTVSCDTFDIYNLSKYGKAYATANCGVSLKDTFVDLRTMCRTGDVVRTFTATSSNGMTASCSQTITIIDTKQFNESNIVWPRDTVLYGCGVLYDSGKTGVPKFSYPGCSRSIGKSMKDQEFTFHENGKCKYIERVWKVIDWCNFDPQRGGPYFTHLQKIHVMDSTKPVITFCPRDTSLNNKGNCLTDLVDVKLDTVVATDCAGIQRVENNSKYSYKNGADASGKYPNGVHKITFTVYDNCGTSSTCSTIITVADKTQPIPICASIATPLQDMGPMGVMAVIMLDTIKHLNVYDNCCLPSQITKSFSKDSIVKVMTFTCAEKGINIVKVYFTDCNGNQTFCNWTVDIQDVHNLCPPTFKDTLMVAGLLQRPNGKGVEFVEVKLDTLKMVCNNSYKFDSLAPKTHLVKPFKDDEPLEGVSTRDIVLIQRFILGKTTLTPYQQIAADANHGGSITSADISELRKLILGMIPKFSNNTSWRFVPQAYKFPAGTMNWGFPESLNVGFGTPPGDVMDAHFFGIKIGDVDGSANFSSLVTREREEGEDFLVLKVSPNPAGEYIVVDCPYFDLFEDGTISIIDMMGRGVYFSKFYSGMEINVKNLNNGIYILKVNSEKLEDSDTKVFLKL